MPILARGIDNFAFYNTKVQVIYSDYQPISDTKSWDILCKVEFILTSVIKPELTSYIVCRAKFLNTNVVLNILR